MTARSRTKQSNSVSTKSGATDPVSEWVRPISEDAPCGPNLEYDNEYVVLLAKLTPQTEVQYGEFVGKPEAPDWSDIERDCRRLLLRSKDITLLIYLCRCRTRLNGAVGLAQSLEGMLEVLQAYPDAVHPQLEVEGQLDPDVRANAMSNLVDPDGLMADVRDIVVASNAAFRLTIKDVERSFALPRPVDAIAPETVQQQLAELQSRGAAEIPALIRAAAAVNTIAEWTQQNLGETAPNLQPLQQLLTRIPACQQPSVKTMAVKQDEALVPLQLNAPGSAVDAVIDAPSTRLKAVSDANRPDSTPPFPTPFTGFTADMSPEQGREHARQTLRAVREWLQNQEPSSPVAVVLQRAEQMIGMNYLELAEVMPLETLIKLGAQSSGIR